MLNMLVYSLMAALNKLHTAKAQKGVTMIEYALIAALIAIVVIAILTILGTDLNQIFTTISGAIQNANNNS